LEDAEETDPALAQSLRYILENDAEDLDIRFSVDEIVNNESVEYELIPNGANILVTKDNAEEYVKLFLEYKFLGR
jgi:hypothetical protein